MLTRSSIVAWPSPTAVMAAAASGAGGSLLMPAAPAAPFELYLTGSKLLCWDPEGTTPLPLEQEREVWSPLCVVPSWHVAAKELRSRYRIYGESMQAGRWPFTGPRVLRVASPLCFV